MNTKICITCKIEKDLKLFCTDNTRKDNLAVLCRPCAKEKLMLFGRSKSGLATLLYNSQKSRAIARRMPKPSYSLHEFKVWLLTNENYPKLFNDWVLSGYRKEIRPSIDRLDDYKNYNFTNIRLVTWRDNNIKGHEDRRNGINNKASKSVSQLTIDGIFIANYVSIRSAARKLDVGPSGIVKCCRKEQNTSHGFKWFFNET